jgi:hypothetical protein
MVEKNDNCDALIVLTAPVAWFVPAGLWHTPQVNIYVVPEDQLAAALVVITVAVL